MELTDRQRLVLDAALAYAYANSDDLNDCLAFDAPDDGDVDQIKVGDRVTDAISEDEIEALRFLFVRPAPKGVGASTKWVIFNSRNRLFWNNDTGWGCKATAAQYTDAEKAEVKSWPLDGAWLETTHFTYQSWEDPD